jgi:crotonobetainyl-CoA:carnitine CoA-transferase CaiB-like acyl-CoA transferase
MSLCRVIGREDWMRIYAQRADRARDYEKIALELKEIFARRERAEWIKLLEREDVPFAPELGVEDLENDPQVRHLGTFYELEHPRHGVVRAQHRPARVDASREIDFRPPPDLGQHTEEILAELREKGAL